jgi:abortive infection bacteriophage resistance protein
VTQLNQKFDKPPLTIEQQIELLMDRGLDIPDHQQAKIHLNFIGYYRLSAYALPFQSGGNDLDRHHFNFGTTFEQVLDLYIFDRKLRLLVMDAIERIEVAIRAVISNVASIKYSPHWFLKPELFERNHDSCLTQLKKDINHDNPNKQERFVKHYYANYTEPELPPSWMIMEVLMLGTLSKLLRKISQETHWEDRLEALFQEYPGVDPTLMGFPLNWRSLPIWG